MRNSFSKMMIGRFILFSTTLSCLLSCNSREAFLTEALDDASWDCSEWISVADAPVVDSIVEDGSRAADGSSWFVTSVANSGKVVSAKWMTTGLGIYEIYVNGHLIGDEILKPGYTHYAKTKYSFTYDVTALLETSPGSENQFSAQVTPGWWADKIVTPAGQKGMTGAKCAFRSVIELVYSDGSRALIGTDTDNWKAGIAGPVKHSAIYDGEIYDAREVPGYECADKLGKPEVNKEFDGEILPTSGAEVYMRKDLALNPVRAYVWKGASGAKEGEYGKVNIIREYSGSELMVLNPGENLVVDFGQNCAGVPYFEFMAESGTRLTCLPAELLNDGNGALSRGMDAPEGSCHRENLRIPDDGMMMEYIFSDASGYVSFSPRCTFFGYRYASVSADSEVKIRKIRSIPVSSITQEMETGSLETGNESINRLIENTLWGQRSNYLSVPTDCPQRNERLGWTADTQVFAQTGSFFADTYSFMRKWMRDMRDTQSPLGGFPGVAPFAQYGSEPTSMMRVGWADAGIIVPWTMWKQFGKVDIIEENWDAMEKFIDHAAAEKYDQRALAEENGNYQWADWLSYEPLESWSEEWKQDPAQTFQYWNFLGASYWLIDARMMRDMAAATGRDVSKYDEMIFSAKEHAAQFLNADGEFLAPVLNTMQTPALFALKNDLVEGQAKANLIARLQDNFHRHGNRLQTGFLGTSILMKTLSDNGMVDIAYELLFQRENPSWLYSVDNGATTIWERWNSYTIEKGMASSGMNSFNHYAYGCVCQWLWETVAGICSDTANPGFKHIIMKPVPDRRLGYMKAEYRSAYGLVRSEWKFEGDRWIWTFTIPEGCTASVTLPSEKQARTYLSGTYCEEIDCTLFEKQN